MFALYPSYQLNRGSDEKDKEPHTTPIDRLPLRSPDEQRASVKRQSDRDKQEGETLMVNQSTLQAFMNQDSISGPREPRNTRKCLSGQREIKLEIARLLTTCGKGA